MDDRIVAIRQKIGPQRPRWADQLADGGYFESGRQFQHFFDPMPNLVGKHRIVERQPL